MRFYLAAKPGVANTCTELSPVKSQLVTIFEPGSRTFLERNVQYCLQYRNLANKLLYDEDLSLPPKMKMSRKGTFK